MRDLQVAGATFDRAAAQISAHDGVATIQPVELTRAGQLMTNMTFQPMVVYPIVAALYFLLCWPLSLLAQALERRIDKALGISRHF